MSSGVLLVVLALVLMVPSAGVHVFAGVPFSTPVEFLTFLLLVPFAVSRGLRRLYGRALGGGRAAVVPILAGAGLVALAAKGVLFALAPPTGFLACYWSPVAPPVSGSCERSYENPFYRFGATRIDRVIDFGPDDWNLSFVNSRRFNFFPPVPGSLRRDRLPIRATWRGTIELAEPTLVEIVYVGEGAVELGAGPVALPPRYAAPATVAVLVPAGRRTVSVDYAFDDGSRLGGGPEPGPYATARVHLRGETGRPAAALAAVPVSPGWRALGTLPDLVVATFTGSLLWLLGRLIGREWRLLAGVAVLGTVVHAYLPDTGWLPRSRGLLFLGAALLVGQVLANTRRRLLASYFGFSYLSLLRIQLDLPDLDRVVIREAGHDWLAYESLARSILDTWSLEGGEKVFSFQPLSRYVRFLEHLAFGDGDGLVAAFALSALNVSLLLLVARLSGWRRVAEPSTLVRGAPPVLLLMLTDSATVIRFVELGASEYPAWIFLSLLFPMLFASSRPAQWMAGTALLGLSLLARANHTPAVALLFACFAVPRCRRRPRVVGTAVALLGALALLPIAHDAYYGGRVALSPADATLPINLVLPPGRLMRVGSDPEAAAIAASQLRGLIYRASTITGAGPEYRQLALGFHGLQFLWALLAFPVVLPRSGLHASARVLWLLPLAYLGVHLLYVQYYYYPRHIIIGHLAMGVVATYLLSPRALAGRQPVSRRIHPSAAGSL